MADAYEGLNEYEVTFKVIALGTDEEDAVTQARETMQDPRFEPESVVQMEETE